MMAETSKSTAKLKTFLNFEKTVQAQWAEEKLFESEINEKESFLATFPYPYMNGFSHLGHAFSLSKLEVR